GQLALFPCFVNFVGFIRRLGAKPKSGQPGSTGDLPQRETAVPNLVKVQGTVRVRSERGHVLA
ncbi:hypothetical protein JQN64_26540, partial [Escherichia coli]|nr:hypothetical protein [Escherichia coli]